MHLKKINYSDLNARQQEIFNFQKISGILADYGYNCIKLADDWQGADFIAYHKNHSDTLRVQLKSRLTIDKKYIGKELYMAFPLKNESWYLIEHDIFIKKVDLHTNWLNTKSWVINGCYTSSSANKTLRQALVENRL
ncbi:MAG: hypothetical protein QM520_03870 [Gammaproteobacteria bacterium]|nr:hypothetical protein [Gammaproteobacteria bacterium]